MCVRERRYAGKVVDIKRMTKIQIQDFLFVVVCGRDAGWGGVRGGGQCRAGQGEMLAGGGSNYFHM